MTIAHRDIWRCLPENLGYPDGEERGKENMNGRAQVKTPLFVFWVVAYLASLAPRLAADVHLMSTTGGKKLPDHPHVHGVAYYLTNHHDAPKTVSTLS